MMQYLVRGQMQSFLISVLIIAIILMIAFQSVRVGLIGLIPNLMPAIFVGGFMGWMGIPLDMMTATLIPMMLGMAVDDTIHFFNHSKLEYDRTPDYSVAIRRTFRVVGVAIVTTSIITSAVFGCFSTSACAMCINFGVLAVIGILSALLADLFIDGLCHKLLQRKLIYLKNANAASLFWKQPHDLDGALVTFIQCSCRNTRSGRRDRTCWPIFPARGRCRIPLLCRPPGPADPRASSYRVHCWRKGCA